MSTKKKKVGFYADERSSMWLADIPVGMRSAYINLAIEQYIEAGQEHMKSLTEAFNALAKKNPSVKSEVRPFSTGSQFADWEERNCNRCTKSYINNASATEGEGPCDIDNALTVAYIADGLVLHDIAVRMGWEPGWKNYTWDCPEREINDAAR